MTQDQLSVGSIWVLRPRRLAYLDPDSSWSDKKVFLVLGPRPSQDVEEEYLCWSFDSCRNFYVYNFFAWSHYKRLDSVVDKT